MADHDDLDRDETRDETGDEPHSEGLARTSEQSPEGADDRDEGAARTDGSDRAGDRISARERAAIEAEERRLAEGAREHDIAAITGLLGIERWVQFAFIAIGVTVVYVADHLIEVVWQYFAEPDSTVVSGSAALLGILTAFLLYRHPRVNELAHEVVGELSKVTWPSRDETYYSTLVVIVTSVIAAVYTGVFDALWSAFTDLIYNV